MEALAQRLLTDDWIGMIGDGLWGNVRHWRSLVGLPAALVFCEYIGALRAPGGVRGRARRSALSAARGSVHTKDAERTASMEATMAQAEDQMCEGHAHNEVGEYDSAQLCFARAFELSGRIEARLSAANMLMKTRRRGSLEQAMTEYEAMRALPQEEWDAAEHGEQLKLLLDRKHSEASQQLRIQGTAGPSELDVQFEEVLGSLGLPASRMEEMRATFDEAKKRQLVELHGSSTPARQSPTSRPASAPRSEAVPKLTIATARQALGKVAHGNTLHTARAPQTTSNELAGSFRKSPPASARTTDMSLRATGLETESL